MPSPPDDAALQLSKARTRLILDKPFLGALVLRLPLVAVDPQYCPKVATDARNFYFNPEYIAGMNIKQMQFVLAHEALHCALTHFARRGNRDRHRWDIACDYATNIILVDEGMSPCPGALVEGSFRGMSAEEIYPSINENPDQETQDGHWYDNEPKPSSADEKDNNGETKQPPPLTNQQRDELKQQWQQRLASALQSAQRAGKLSASLARMAERLIQPALPWQAVLARYINSLARVDYSFARPSSRREGPALYPTLRSHNINIVAAVDTSGSVNTKDLAQFTSELNSLRAQVHGRVTLIACDSELAPGSPWVYEPWQDLELPKQWKGGGGTRFVPVFDWIATQDIPPDVLIYFTDGKGEFPKRAPLYPVLWLIKGAAKVPWGERLALN
ncbi:MAG: VWA-like domain-containing protein [Gammaproteobacteria bacterium]|nr:VWA-like domain-containing protein [Gammaproteobacteria bacterium]